MKELLIGLNAGCAFFNAYTFGHYINTIPVTLCIFGIIVFIINILGIVKLSKEK